MKLIFVSDKYIFDIVILSDNFDYTSIAITMLASTVLISTAQGKNIKHKT